MIEKTNFPKCFETQQPPYNYKLINNEKKVLYHVVATFFHLTTTFFQLVITATVFMPFHMAALFGGEKSKKISKENIKFLKISSLCLKNSIAAIFGKKSQNPQSAVKGTLLLAPNTLYFTYLSLVKPFKYCSPSISYSSIEEKEKLAAEIEEEIRTEGVDFPGAHEFLREIQEENKALTYIRSVIGHFQTNASKEPQEVARGEYSALTRIDFEQTCGYLIRCIENHFPRFSTLKKLIKKDDSGQKYLNWFAFNLFFKNPQPTKMS